MPVCVQLHVNYKSSGGTFFLFVLVWTGNILTVSIDKQIIIINIIIINRNWVVTRLQWLLYMHTKYEIGY